MVTGPCPALRSRASAPPAALLLVLLSTANANTSLVKAGGYALFLFALVGVYLYFGALSVAPAVSRSRWVGQSCMADPHGRPGPARYLSIRMGR